MFLRLRIQLLAAFCLGLMVNLDANMSHRMSFFQYIRQNSLEPLRPLEDVKHNAGSNTDSWGPYQVRWAF